MKEDRIIEPHKIHMITLKTLKGNIDTPAGIDASLIKGHSYEFIVGTGVDIEAKVVGLELTINIIALGKGNEILPIKGSYTHEIQFQVENLDDFLDISEGDGPPVMDGILNGTLTGIAFSTVRGIIFSRTQGTSLGTVILPVIDPKKVMGKIQNGENTAGTEENIIEKQ